ncbi:MAG: bifunctional riboflavin kinase/FAD synthetase [Gammaproteobacteria bacterium]|nr:bifunctional riboflavin kinase/FAD synthetase [Gammaproteobacteria bacterium]
MRIIRNRPEWSDGAYVPGRTAVAIGNFDGVHLGHQALIARCRELAGAGEDTAVVTFEPLPLAYFRPELAPPRLTTVYRKLELLQALEVDHTWLMRFDTALAALEPQAFVERILVERMRAWHVVIGSDFRFGKDRTGSIELLAYLGEELDFSVNVVPSVMLDGERISSSGIRKMLAAGDFDGAARWLGRPFRMEGRVLRGAGLGRKLGYPTANLAVRAEPSPVTGVLAAWARIGDGPWLPSVTNLGRRPVVDGKETLLEVHFFDFDEDLYGQRLDVQFVAKLRDELDFEGLEALVDQMKQDEAAARDCLAAADVPE